jgi:hypothetical protein
MEIAIVIALGVSAAALLVSVFWGPRRWAPRLEKRKVIVHTTDGSIDGVLMVSARDGLVMQSATYLDDGTGENPKLAGELFVPREKVSFIQVP